jgi:hypothetical protein
MAQRKNFHLHTCACPQARPQHKKKRDATGFMAARLTADTANFNDLQARCTFMGTGVIEYITKEGSQRCA